ncbi:MAG: CAP domain-containing protein [Verrucomicrobiae bacterium]|nr:CAP domain-containing protein [Verrucomicrobiae bacterium]NNJ87506.1 CAP domain-containing protein [Akkermansiaceae bacterium]
MNTIINILTCCGVALVISSCASNLNSPNGTASAPANVSSKDRAIAERVFSLINSERARVGKKAMRGHGGLNRLAQNHSNQMGSSMSNANHMGSQNRAQYAYLRYSIENLSEMTYAVPAGSSDPAAVAVAAWKRSPEHSRHMLQTWDLTGVGVKSAANGQTYITMCMGAQPMGVPRGVQPVGWSD